MGDPQLFPHAPQLAASVERLTQPVPVPVQSARPCDSQESEHPPSAHTCDDVHIAPHDPQFCELVWVLAQ